jgi:hypothetical protein
MAKAMASMQPATVIEMAEALIEPISGVISINRKWAEMDGRSRHNLVLVAEAYLKAKAAL